MKTSAHYHQLLSLLDITRLQDNDTAAAMQQWLDEMATADAVPAAFCVYPQFIELTKNHLKQHGIQAKLATVVNFPQGQQSIDQVVSDIERYLAAGADEIDCVLPYHALLRAEYGVVKNFLYDIKQACGNASLKVIIESGELATSQQIIKATELCLQCGADFVKTSTGKVPVGCTTDAARCILTVIAASGTNAGFKASGGVRTVAQAFELVEMFEQIVGSPATADRMRIGASALLQELKPLL